jgi:hypothetical protein
LPGLPGSAHDLHVPEQGMSQQTPPSHRFEPHSLGSVQGPPSGFLPQLPTAGIDALGVQTLPAV